MAIEKINMQLAGLPPAWMSRIVGQTGAFGNATEIKKLLGEPIPQLIDPETLPPELAAFFASNGILERLRRKLARLTGRRGGKIFPAKNTIASVDDEDNLYVGVDFLEQFGQDEDLLAGILSHEWGHMISDLPRGKDWSHLTWDEVFALRRDEEADADGFAGRVLYLFGYRPDAMMEFLKMIDRRKKNKKLATHKYHNTATRVEILRQSFKASERALKTAQRLFTRKHGPKFGRVLGDG